MLRAIGLFTIVVAICGAPPPARADCEVTDTGIPDDVAFKLDPGGVRQALAKGGVMLSGTYYWESFGNWGASGRASPMTACSTCVSTRT
jgi:hypothetical protein